MAVLSLSAIGILLVLYFLCFPKSKLIAPDQVNPGRQFEIDLAKTISVVWMILVHVTEESSADAAAETGWMHWFDLFVEFTGGPLAAPVFMTAMGIGIAYSKNQLAGPNAIRGLKLIGDGYWLNVVRGALPCFVFFALGSKQLFDTGIEELLCLDILHFAGLTFLFFALVKRFRCSDLQLGIAALALLFAAALLPSMYPGGELRSVWIGYFVYQNPLTPFPLFNWLIYPVTGYLFGKLLQRVNDKKKFYTRLLLWGALLLTGFSILLNLCGYELSGLFVGDNMYSQNPVKVFWVFGIMAVWCAALYFASPFLAARERFKRLIDFMSKRINTVYFAQWILIGWLKWSGLLECSGYGGKFLGLFVAIAVLSVTLTYGVDAVQKKKK